MICCNVGQLLPLKSPHISVLLIFNRWVTNWSRLWLSFLCFIAIKDSTLCVNYHLLNQITAPWKLNQQKKLHEQRILNGWASTNHKQPQIFLRFYEGLVHIFRFLNRGCWPCKCRFTLATVTFSLEGYTKERPIFGNWWHVLSVHAQDRCYNKIIFHFLDGIYVIFLTVISFTMLCSNFYCRPPEAVNKRAL